MKIDWLSGDGKERWIRRGLSLAIASLTVFTLQFFLSFDIDFNVAMFDGSKQANSEVPNSNVAQGLTATEQRQSLANLCQLIEQDLAEYWKRIDQMPESVAKQRLEEAVGQLLEYQQEAKDLIRQLNNSGGDPQVLSRIGGSINKFLVKVSGLSPDTIVENAFGTAIQALNAEAADLLKEFEANEELLVSNEIEIKEEIRKRHEAEEIAAQAEEESLRLATKVKSYFDSVDDAKVPVAIEFPRFKVVTGDFRPRRAPRRGNGTYKLKKVRSNGELILEIEIEQTTRTRSLIETLTLEIVVPSQEGREQHFTKGVQVKEGKQEIVVFNKLFFANTHPGFRFGEGEYRILVTDNRGREVYEFTFNVT